MLRGLERTCLSWCFRVAHCCHVSIAQRAPPHQLVCLLGASFRRHVRVFVTRERDKSALELLSPARLSCFTGVHGSFGLIFSL